MSVQVNKKGFTIIEVVLVLAIAALIFLMIFVALPALQRGQANSARKSDVGIVASAINTYRTNNDGSLPDEASDLENYIDNLSQLEIDPDGGFVDGAGTVAATDNSNVDFYTVFTGAKCDGDVAVDGSNRQAAVITVLEVSAGNYEAFCQDS